MKRRYPIVLLVVLVVAIALSAALATSDAGATTAWTCGGASCHNSTAVHGVAAHAAGLANPPTSCTTVCHTDGAAAPPPPSACAGCHPTVPAEGTHASAAGTGCNAYTPCHGGASPSPSPTPTDTGTPSPTPTATDTPTPDPTATDDGSGTGGVTDEDEDADDVGFPATGYPPSDGSSTPWLLITGAFAAGLALLFAVWRVPAARRHD
jgi:hypothetical protein